ncbi:Neoverrucotoxin subunit beta [Channa argus]|uniref:Neoverrucotoxin subunit beta n=1 Tax=Channa argus TaxID=215402 RepID=A0A6G1PDJ1_CHAAH|nr:Neoverrucotoxin subunit beta [Channa argus]
MTEIPFNHPKFISSFRVEHCGEQRLKPGVNKYFCKLSVDTNTVNRKLTLSYNNNRVRAGREEQPYPDHPGRFDACQLMCRNALTGRCYWEVVWGGKLYISVTYRGIRRKGKTADCWFGWNNQSWSLLCSEDGYSARHNNRNKVLPSPQPSSSFSVPDTVAVYVDCPAGILSFYRVSSEKLIHLHTFNTTFTEPLYAGFGFCLAGSFVFLC